MVKWISLWWFFMFLCESIHFPWLMSHGTHWYVEQMCTICEWNISIIATVHITMWTSYVPADINNYIYWVAIFICVDYNFPFVYDVICHIWLIHISYTRNTIAWITCPLLLDIIKIDTTLYFMHNWYWIIDTYCNWHINWQNRQKSKYSLILLYLYILRFTHCQTLSCSHAYFIFKCTILSVAYNIIYKNQHFFYHNESKVAVSMLHIYRKSRLLQCNLLNEYFT